MGHIPKPWWDVREVLIPKPGRELSLAKFYRPISLSSAMLKTLERLMDKFLKEGALTGEINRTHATIACNKDRV